MTVLVEARDLRRTFEVSKSWLERIATGAPRRILTAVDGASFEIARNETFALVGESGSGKSTVARMAVGLLKPTSGTILVGGAAPRPGKRISSPRVQMIFQDPYASLNPRWRIGSIIAEPMRGRAEPRSAPAARVEDLLKLVGLHPADARRYPREFSGGQRQRIAIARALAAEPDFIACDEPTSALDVSVQAQILNLMQDLQRRLGLAYLLISHDLTVVRHMAARIGVMYLGRIVETATRRQLFDAPRHPYTRMLLDSAPDLSLAGRPRLKASGEIPSSIDPPSGCAFHPRCPFANERCARERPALTAGVACHAESENRLPAYQSRSSI